MGFAKIKSKIQNNYEDLPKNQRKIAEFFIESFDQIPFLSVQDIARKTDASVASVVRFAQRIGFSGFSEMRDEIAATLQNQIKNKDIFPLIENLEEDSLTYVANQDIRNINDTLNLIDRNNFNRAVELIMTAKRIFTAGLGISFLQARILAYQLTQVGLDARSFRMGDASLLEQVLFVQPADVLITFSFPPYSKATIDVAKLANERDVEVIAITNRKASPITFYSACSLVVKSENLLYTNSFAAISVVINALATECALRNKTRAEEMLANLNYLEEIDHTYIAK